MLSKQVFTNSKNNISTQAFLRQAIQAQNITNQHQPGLIWKTQENSRISTEIYNNLTRLFATNDQSGKWGKGAQKFDDSSERLERAAQNMMRSHDQNDKKQFKPKYETKESIAMRQSKKQKEEQSQVDQNQPEENKTDVTTQEQVTSVEEQIKMTKLFQETDINSEAFKKTIKDFCHSYQIPYLENSVSKTCRNAAKILYRMMNDGKRPNSRFQELTDYLLSIPKEEIDESFNPLKQREKWMKFFRSGSVKIMVDTDRALKNEISDPLRMFIQDQRMSFNDKQLIKAILIIAKTVDFRLIKEKDKMINTLTSNIIIGKFEFKKGNTLASLAEALSTTFESMFPGITDPAKQLYLGEDVYQPPSEIMNQSTHIVGQEWYFRLLKTMHKLIPFYHFYFDYYLLQKKVVVLSMYTQMRVFDEHLYQNLVKTIDQLVQNVVDTDQVLSSTHQTSQKQQSHSKSQQTSGSSIQTKKQQQNDLTMKYSESYLQKLDKLLVQMCSTQNPIHNNEIDRFNEMMDSLEFYAQEMSRRKGASIDICALDFIKRETIDKLLLIALRRIEKDKELVLMTDHASSIKKFNIKMQYLLTPEQKKVYYSEIADMIIDSVKQHKIQNVNNDYSTVPLSPYAIINHLKNSFELEYLPRKQLATLFAMAQDTLISQYESKYERLVMKEVMFMAANNFQEGLEIMDENEILIDQIIKYRESFDGFIQLCNSQPFQDIIHQIGGLRPELYEKYANMIVLNEICEKFLNSMGQIVSEDAAQTELNQELQGEKSDNNSMLFSADYYDKLSSSNFNEENSDGSLTFYPYLKKKWLLTRNLIKPEFIQQAPEHLRNILGNLKQQTYDPVVPIIKLRNQFLINYNIFQSVRNYLKNSTGGGRNMGGPDNSFGSSGVLKQDPRSNHYQQVYTQTRFEKIQEYMDQIKASDQDSNLNIQGGDSTSKNTQKLLESLFEEDHDLKMKLASQYDMLGFVGSEIDEIKMDQLSFFKIYNQQWGGVNYTEANYNFDEISNTNVSELLQTDLSTESLLNNFEGANISKGTSFIGLPYPIHNSNCLKSLAFFSQIKTDLSQLLDEIHLQLDNIIDSKVSPSDKHASSLLSPILLQKTLNDLFECLDDRDSLAVLLSSDINLYRKIQKAQYTLNALTQGWDSAEAKKIFEKAKKAKDNEIKSIHQHAEEQKSGISRINVMDVINTDDSQLYHLEQLRNFNKYYFDPYLNEKIPYRESSEDQILFQRNLIKSQAALFEKIQDNQLNIINNIPKLKENQEVQLIGGNAQDGQSVVQGEGLKKLNLFFNYIDAFSNAVLNTFTLEQLETFLNNPIACSADKSLQDLLNMDFTDPELSLAYKATKSQLPQSILSMLKVKNYSDNPVENMNLFNTMILKSGVVRSYISEVKSNQQSQRVIQDKRSDLLRTVLEQNKFQNLNQLVLNESSQDNQGQKLKPETKIIKEVAVFPYNLDYFVVHNPQSTSNAKYTVVSLNKQTQKDSVESLIKEQKVMEVFNKKNTSYQEIDFTDIKIEQFIQ